MNKLFPIILLVIAGALLLFFIATQTPVSKHIPVLNELVSPTDSSSTQSSSGSQTNEGVSSNRDSSSSSTSSGSSAGSSGSDSGSEEHAPNYCTDESREIDSCDVPSHIVCGWYSATVQCEIGPCVRMFGNECEACRDNSIEYWTEGECPIHG